MDKFPVTNLQFKKFLDATNYQPQDTLNFLKHWKNNQYPEGEANFPVVHVSYEDARAYAAWAGKRLPTESEWQYAAQAGNQWAWPWGNEFDSTRCNNNSDRLTPVDMFSSGENPFGLMDLVGNVWQLTNDLYDNGSYYFIIIRGGSYYHPTSSWWYVKGGPQPLNRTQMLLRVSPGFERNATVGFRCVKDAE
jgi:iron(II)-dependent oxidoreductase